MKKLLLIIGLIITYNYAFTQEAAKFLPPKFGFIMSVSTPFDYLNDLNSFFESNDIKQLDESVFNQGIGFYIRSEDEFLYSSFQYAMFNAENDDQNLSSNLKGWGLYVSINYDFLKNKPATLLYPKIGFGHTSFELDLINKNYNETEFSQIIGNLTGEKSFKSNNIFYVDLGMGFEKRIRIFYMDFHLGLNLSYAINFNKFEWKSSQGQVVSSIPSIKTNGFKWNVVFRAEIDWQKSQDFTLFKK